MSTTFFLSSEVAILLNGSRNFRVIYGPNYALNCTAYLLESPPGKQGQAHLYPPKEYEGAKFLDWIDRLIKTAIKQSNAGV